MEWNGREMEWKEKRWKEWNEWRNGMDGINGRNSGFESKVLMISFQRERKKVGHEEEFLNFSNDGRMGRCNKIVLGSIDEWSSESILKLNEGGIE